MEPERRRTFRLAVDGDGSSALLRSALPVALRDISAGGLRLGLSEALEPGGIYPLTALLRGLSLAASVRITRCRPGAPSAGSPGDGASAWEAGAEFLWRDEADALTVRRWLERRPPASS
jgi:hypothetical protein